MRLLTSPDAMVGLAEALGNMSNALFILDELDAPGEIATSLDLAIGRLSRLLRQGPEERAPVHRMLEKLEREFVGTGEYRPVLPDPWEISPV